MSDLLQLGQHPDADQLTAFVEHTLPANEQEETLAHLATCADCRKIVALSLPPIEVPAVVEPEPEPVAAPWFNGWFSGWRLAWIAAPALAALVLLTIHLHTRGNNGRSPANPPSLTAGVRKPSQDEAVPMKARSAAAKKPKAQHRPPAPKARNPESADTVEDAAAPAARGRDFAAVKPPPAPAQSMGGPVVAYGQGAGVGSGLGAAPRRPVSGAALGFLKRPLPATVPGRSAQASLSPAVSTGESPISAPSSAMAAPDRPGAIAAGNAMGANSVLASNLPQSATRPVSTGNAFRKNTIISIQAALPSGLPLLSFAAYQQHRIAIDTGNQLFFSEDSGQHWRAVPSPWRGRAIAAATTGVSHIPEAYGNSQPMGLAVPERFTPGEAAVVESGTPSDSFSGTITDASGAVVPHATVAITDSRTASVRTVETDSGGSYRVTDFVPGLYRVDVRASGFLKQSLLVDLSSSSQVVRNIVLEVGSISQTVTVEAATMSLDTESSPIPQAGAAKTRQLRSRVSAGEMVQPAIFVITTDAGERWTSSDGQNWKPE